MVRVVGDVEILGGVTLTIAAGVRVEFAGHHAVRIGGRLLAIGTPEAPITFTSASPGDFAIDHTLAGSWNGLRFEGAPATSGTSRLEDCVLEYAKAVWGKYLVGPLVLVNASDLQVVNCVIRHNVADHGAAIFCVQGSSPQLSGCLITDNQAFRAGSVVFSLDSYPRLRGCTIAGNHDLNPEIFEEAAAVTSYFGKPSLAGDILWGNTTHYFEPAQTWQTKIFCTTWSDLEGSHDGVGNLDADPCFAGAGEHPYAPLPISPCLDKGPPDAAGWPAEDISGRARIHNGRVDMGAYEAAIGTAVLPDDAAVAWLAAPRPNPANPRTTIAFALPAGARARVRIYDLRGRLVRALSDGPRAAGRGEVAWNGCDDAGRGVASGAYLVRLDVAGHHFWRPVTVVR